MLPTGVGETQRKQGQPVTPVAGWVIFLGEKFSMKMDEGYKFHELSMRTVMFFFFGNHEETTK